MTPSPDPRSRTLPALTWAVLALCVVANSLASVAGAGLAVHLGLAALTAVCVAALTVAHLRVRR